jgi:folylpolyglutamate synthase/dihydropteroate synthase
MKPRCPVVIAPQDSNSVLDTLAEHAKLADSPYKIAQPAQFVSANTCQLDSYTYSIQLFGDYQRMNSATAVTALDWMNQSNMIKMTPEQLARGMKDTKWPGRLDWIQLNDRYGLDSILADGAHNPPATIALRNYVDSLNKIRVIWIIASTRGKNISEMMQELIRDDDIVLAVSFTQPAGMPWIASMNPNDIAKEAKGAKQVECLELEKALERAGSIREKDDLVVLCGSLYLVADLYRLLV